MKKQLFAGITGLVLLFSFTFASCNNGVQEVSGDVNVNGTTGSPGVHAPELSAMPMAAGVLLTWDPVIDITSYTVYRRPADGGAKDKRIGTVASTTRIINQYQYFDLQDDDPNDPNLLEPNKEYIYTVVAQSSTYGKDNSWTEKRVTTVALAAKGTKVQAPSIAAAPVLNPAEEKIEVTINSPADTTKPIPGVYIVTLYCNGYFAGSTIQVSPAGPQTKAVINWIKDNQFDGPYTVRVSGALNDYYKRSDTVESPDASYDNLFSVSRHTLASLSASNNSYGGGTAAILSFNNFDQKNQAYTVERTEVDRLGNINTEGWSPVTLYPDASGASGAFTSSDLTSDNNGVLPKTSGFDRNVTVGRTYRYRVKAVSGGVTQYLEANSSVTIY